jgi:acyl-[acyl-carrier-protein] desaturase
MNDPSSETLAVLHREWASDRPRFVNLLSREARAAAIERSIHGLYRWYTQHSQTRRDWHPDTCVDWRTIRVDHADEVHTIVEGFFAVEQYTPDYVMPLLGLIRRTYGRAQWQMRWGAEEARHADLWRNAVLAFRRRDERWIDDYTATLRSREWRLPWESPFHMVFYQMIQERATQVSYLNLGLAACRRLPRLQTSRDDALAGACRLIAVDEAAHYHFFSEVARLFLYYDTERALDAFVDVLRLFTMPARDLVPDYDTFGAILHRTGVFSRSIHYRDVVEAVLGALALPARRALEAGVRRAREIPDDAGDRRTAAFLDTLDMPALETKVRALHRRVTASIARAGFTGIVDCHWQAAWAAPESTR